MNEQLQDTIGMAVGVVGVSLGVIFLPLVAYGLLSYLMKKGEMYDRMERGEKKKP